MCFRPRICLSATNGEWSGTATELLATLDQQASDSLRRAKEWPKAPNALSAAITRAAPGLREIGVDVADKQIHGRKHFTLTDIKKDRQKDRHHRHPILPESESINKSSALVGADVGADGANVNKGIGTQKSEGKSLSGKGFPSKGADRADDFPALSSSSSPDVSVPPAPPSSPPDKPKSWETDL